DIGHGPAVSASQATKNQPPFCITAYAAQDHAGIPGPLALGKYLRRRIGMQGSRGDLKEIAWKIGLTHFAPIILGIGIGRQHHSCSMDMAAMRAHYPVISLALHAIDRAMRMQSSARLLRCPGKASGIGRRVQCPRTLIKQRTLDTRSSDAPMACLTFEKLHRRTTPQELLGSPGQLLFTLGVMCQM